MSEKNRQPLSIIEYIIAGSSASSESRNPKYFASPPSALDFQSKKVAFDIPEDLAAVSYETPHFIFSHIFLITSSLSFVLLPAPGLFFRFFFIAIIYFFIN